MAVESREEEVVSERCIAKEDVFAAERRAGSLSPRGQLIEQQCESSSLVIDIFNLDPIIQQVQENTAFGKGVNLGDKVRFKGTRYQAPTDCSLRSKSKFSSNSFTALSHD